MRLQISVCHPVILKRRSIVKYHVKITITRKTSKHKYFYLSFSKHEHTEKVRSPTSVTKRCVGSNQRVSSKVSETETKRDTKISPVSSLLYTPPQVKPLILLCFPRMGQTPRAGMV